MSLKRPREDSIASASKDLVDLEKIGLIYVATGNTKLAEQLEVLKKLLPKKPNYSLDELFAFASGFPELLSSIQQDIHVVKKLQLDEKAMYKKVKRMKEIDRLNQYLPPAYQDSLIPKLSLDSLTNEVDFRSCCKAVNMNEDMMVKICSKFFGSTLIDNPTENNTSGLLAFIKNDFKMNVTDIMYGDIPSVNGHFVKKNLFVRECYSNLSNLILNYGNECPICITGDPGIGKSYFSLYMFMVLVGKDESVVRIGVGGSALVYYNRRKSITFYPGGVGSLDLWRISTTWLLVDGRVDKPFFEKKARGVVFASSNGNESEKFIKDDGVKLYMPPWTLAESHKFISKLDKDSKSELLKKFVALEKVPLSSKPVYEQLQMIISDRFGIVGGRIRLLLHAKKSSSQMRNELVSASELFVSQGSFLIDTQSCINIPSLLFSIYPRSSSDGEISQSNFITRFCSEEARNIVVDLFKQKSNADRSKIFALACETPNCSVLSGLIYESLFHREICHIIDSKSYKEFESFWLSPELEGGKAKLKLKISYGKRHPHFENGCLHVYFDSYSYFETEPEAGKPFVFQIPSKPNHPDVDSIGKFLAFKATFQRHHAFQNTRMKEVADRLGVLFFMYVVPSTRAQNFSFQSPVNANGQKSVYPRNHLQCCLVYDGAINDFEERRAAVDGDNNALINGDDGGTSTVEETVESVEQKIARFKREWREEHIEKRKAARY